MSPPDPWTKGDRHRRRQFSHRPKCPIRTLLGPPQGAASKPYEGLQDETQASFDGGDYVVVQTFDHQGNVIHDDQTHYVCS